MRLYDRPGSWLVDHPNARRAVAATIASLTFAVAPMAMSATAKNPDRVPKDPGGVSQYGASSAAGSHVLKD